MKKVIAIVGILAIGSSFAMMRGPDGPRRIAVLKVACKNGVGHTFIKQVGPGVDPESICKAGSYKVFSVKPQQKEVSGRKLPVVMSTITCRSDEGPQFTKVVPAKRNLRGVCASGDYKVSNVESVIRTPKRITNPIYRPQGPLRPPTIK
ncbi:MAG TPA: hypothetical protein QGF02_01400 [Candidatus Babeliales bacterium]|nr:hypothetical protein [Candidatus Babeliales bacterium]